MIQTTIPHRIRMFLILTAFFFTTLAMASGNALARELVRLNDQELDAVTGQAGFAFMLNSLTGMDVFQNEATLAIGRAADPAKGENGAWISLSDIAYQGTFGRSLAEAGARVTLDSHGQTVITMDQSVLIDVRNFHSSLRLGAEPGAGDTLGALHIASLTATVSGTIRISQIQPGI